MCMSSTPVASPTVTKPQFMHNSYLDGINEGEGLTIGRNSLRIDQTNGPHNLDVPTVTGNSNGQGLVTPTSQAPRPVSAAPAGSATGAMGAMVPTTPGMVIPTVGGALAGALPPNVTISGAGAAK